MKIRNITYGYQIRDGMIQLQPEEAEVVKRIFADYIAGRTLKQIAEDLTERIIPYFPGKSRWDKARVKRILDQRKYLGSGDYPCIIQQEQFRAAQDGKPVSAKTGQADPAHKWINSLIICDACGQKMKRSSFGKGGRYKGWKCPSCGHSVKAENDEFKQRLYLIQRTIVSDPDVIKMNENSSKVQSIRVTRLVNEIHRSLDSMMFSEDELVNMALQCAAENYSSIQSVRHITDRLTAVLRNAEPLSGFSLDLLRETVRAIRLDSTGTIRLEMKNGAIVNETEITCEGGIEHGVYGPTTEGDSYPS